KPSAFARRNVPTKALRSDSDLTFPLVRFMIVSETAKCGILLCAATNALPFFITAIGADCDIGLAESDVSLHPSSFDAAGIRKRLRRFQLKRRPNDVH
ncbi:MAG: hypothetical protein OXT69_12985, partial [Candidatus Poribacteria bacterium]|nr:hypothetical protein [Candidatus Poribacteria bacterium]